VPFLAEIIEDRAESENHLILIRHTRPEMFMTALERGALQRRLVDA
jgi:hypothetical protein